MSTTTELLEPDTSEIKLEPMLGPAWALMPHHLLVVALFVAMFMLLNYLPLRETDLWGHVFYGKWILEHRAIPTADPMLPLAEGMRVIDSAWLAQVAFAWVESVGGADWLSNLFAVMTVATFLFWLRTSYLQTGRIGLAAIGTLCAIGVGLSRVATIRPENFAALFFAVLLWLITSSREPSLIASESPDAKRRTLRLWIGIPILFGLWANMHGSFVCGLAVLGCFTLGRALEVLWKQRDFSAVLADSTTRQWLLLTELGLLATLVNPYGIDLWIETVRFASNPNLEDVTEWFPMVFASSGGREFLASWVALTVLLRHSRRPMPVTHVLLLAVFALAAVLRVRMIGWYAPVFAWVCLPHLAEIAARYWPARTDIAPPATIEEEPLLPAGRSWKYSLVALLLIWIGFALSPIGRPFLGDDPRDAKQLFGDATPVALTEYLVKNPPSGQIYNPQRWGDWLGYKGPPGMKLFMTTNMHLAPTHVWRDYLRAFSARAGWSAVFDVYGVNTVVADKRDQVQLVQTMKSADDWKIDYEDDIGVVFSRKPPKPPEEPKPEAEPLAAYPSRSTRASLAG